MGGKPTTIFLRYRETYLDDVTRQRYFNRLKKLMSHNLPTKNEESADPVSADNHYNACTQYLINNTRDKSRFSLIFTENVNFGFRRNLWGMKSLAILIIIICLIAQIVENIKSLPLDLKIFMSSQLYISIILYLILLIIWSFIIKPEWIKVVGFEYAKRLYESIDIL